MFPLRNTMNPIGNTKRIVSSDWWLSGGVSSANAIAVYSPFGAASLGASYSNLANPGVFDAVPGVAPGWDAINGWAGNGSAYLRTGIIPASGWSMIAKVSNVTDGMICGSDGLVGGYIRFWIQVASTLVAYGAGSGVAVALPTLSSGTLCVVADTVIRGYRNGVADATNTTAYSFPGAEIALLARGRTNAGVWAGATEPLTGNIQRVAIYNTILTPSQVAAIHAAM